MENRITDLEKLINQLLTFYVNADALGRECHTKDNNSSEYFERLNKKKAELTPERYDDIERRLDDNFSKLRTLLPLYDNNVYSYEEYNAVELLLELIKLNYIQHILFDDKNNFIGKEYKRPILELFHRNNNAKAGELIRSIENSELQEDNKFKKIRNIILLPERVTVNTTNKHFGFFDIESDDYGEILTLLLEFLTNWQRNERRGQQDILDELEITCSELEGIDAEIKGA